MSALPPKADIETDPYYPPRDSSGSLAILAAPPRFVFGEQLARRFRAARNGARVGQEGRHYVSKNEPQERHALGVRSLTERLGCRGMGRRPDRVPLIAEQLTKPN